MSEKPSLARFGYRFGHNGAHSARTMMFDEISALLDHLPETASRVDYAREVIEHNALDKSTQKSRELSLRHLIALYGLTPELPLFRVFRRLWRQDEIARPVLALTLALARDPLLHSSQEFILGKTPGAPVVRAELEQLLVINHPDRFSPASVKSIAQNLSGSWTRAGYLKGHVRKIRAVPPITPANLAFCLFMSHLEGLSGQRLFTSSWLRLLSDSPIELERLAIVAAQRELLVFLSAGGIQEVRFPGYLTAEEEAWLHE
jgi:hypothetical protein